MIRKHGSARWQGDLKTGKGVVSTESGALTDQPYGFNTRFEDGAGTNPEELIGAAHASCFSMAVSAELGRSGVTAESIETKSVISLEKDGDGFTVTKAELTSTITAPGADKAAVEAAANGAKSGCPISKLLNAAITLDLTVEV